MIPIYILIACETEESEVPQKTQRVKRSTRKKKSRSRKPRGLNLAALAAGTVPAHGLVMSQGFSRGLSFGSTFFPWMKRLLGACAVASAIAMGLFVYTEFVQAWKIRGLPTIPIAALQAIGQAGQEAVEHTPYAATRQSPRGDPRQQKLSQLDDYVG